MGKIKTETDQLRKKIKQIELKEVKMKGEHDEKIERYTIDISKYQNRHQENQEKMQGLVILNIKLTENVEALSE